MLRTTPLRRAWRVCLCALPAMAAGAQDPASSAEPGATGDHGPGFEEIIVTAHPLSDTGLVQPAQVLAGEALDQERGANIGATVERLPGVRSAAFGEAAGRPIIHGVGGPRVRVLEDRADTLDVSVSSTDHMVTVEPFLADRVEVLKGPATLLYGSGAIGGVVNVDTGRIADTLPDDDFKARLELRGDDNGDARVGAMRLDGAVGRLVWHLDGFRREAGDYSIPGFAESARLRAREEEHGEDDHHDDDGHGDDGHDDDDADDHDDDHDDGDDHDGDDDGHDDDDDHDGDDHDGDDHDGDDDHEDEAPEHGRVAGSDYDVRGGAVGVSFVGERAFAGISFSRMDSDYGLPGGHAHAHGEEGDDHGHGDEHGEDHDDDEAEHGEDHGDEEAGHDDEHGEEGNPWLDMEQQRVDVELGLLDPFASFERLTARIGYNDYEHAESEGNGEVATVFANKAYDARAELVQAATGAWRNVYGAQLGGVEFSALGAEAFIPPVDTNSAALFWAGERPVGGRDLEAGLRIERVRHEPSERASGPDRSFTAYAASLGIIAPLGDAWRFSVLGDLSSRAPGSEALYSNGPHVATRSFEIGDASLDTEQAMSVSAKAEYRGERVTASATAYHRRFGDFIHQLLTDEEEDGLPVYRYAQEDATFTGLDFEATLHLWERGDWHGDLTLMFDVLAAQLDVDGNDNLPRIPPSRGGAGLVVDNGRFSATLDYLRSAEQDDVAHLELPTDAYEDLRVRLRYKVAAAGWDISFFLQGKNLTDDEQRDHVSFIKDMVPRPGRTVEAGVRITL